MCIFTLKQVDAESVCLNQIYTNTKEREEKRFRTQIIKGDKRETDFYMYHRKRDAK